VCNEGRFEFAKCQLCCGTILSLLSEVVVGTSSVSFFFIGNASEMEVKRTFWHFTPENTHVNTSKNIAIWLLVPQKLAIHVCYILYSQNEFRPQTSVAFTLYVQACDLLLRSLMLK